MNHLLLYITFLIGFVPSTNLSNDNAADAIIGTWKCDSYDIIVDVYQSNNKYYASLLQFPCNHKIKLPLYDHFDIKNPDPEKRKYRMLHMNILFDMEYMGNAEWANGQAYIPSIGEYFRAKITKINNQKMELRVYKGFEFFGKSVQFSKQ